MRLGGLGSDLRSAPRGRMSGQKPTVVTDRYGVG